MVGFDIDQIKLFFKNRIMIKFKLYWSDGETELQNDTDAIWMAKGNKWTELKVTFLMVFTWKSTSFILK